MIHVTINGETHLVSENKTILEVCNDLSISIPTFCHDDRLKPEGSCRICVVEVTGARGLMPACATKIAEGMEIQTHSPAVVTMRKQILELIWSTHPNHCLLCEKAGDCKLQTYSFEYRINTEKFKGEKKEPGFVMSNEFFYLDQSKCILCGKCVRTCKELQCNDVYALSNRGFETQVKVPFGEKFSESPCVSCGNCVSNCPVGALMPKNKERYRSWETKKTKTTCAYCGVGCQMELCTVGNKVVEVKPVKEATNEGLLCVKGKFAYNYINHKDRLTTPLIKKDGAFVPATFEEAYQYIKEKADAIKAEKGDYCFASLSSARCTNEENYLMQKLTRAVFKTNNIDHCARLCHASTVSGLAKTLGSGAMTNSIEEAKQHEVAFIIGSNTTETHPVIGAMLKQGKRNHGTKFIVADPRKIDLAEEADVYLQIKPGSNIALLNAMMKIIIEEGLYDEAFIEERTEQFEDFKETMEAIDLQEYIDICGVEEHLVREAARMYATANTAAIYFAMGITQFRTGTNNVMSISNLALMCGHLGKEGCGINPLRGQNNVQGACDMGATPADFPGYQKVADEAVVEKFETAWKTNLSRAPGNTLPQLLNLCHHGDIQFMYIMGENPMISDPDSAHVEAALRQLPLLVVQDIFLTETAALADVVLPATTFAEKDGTFTNTERRVQRVRKAIEPIGNAKPDWQILCDLFHLFGHEAHYRSSEDVFNELASLTPSYAGMDYERIDQNGLQWPCPTKDHPGTKFLHKDQCTRGKGLFVPVIYTPPYEVADETYPLVLTTGRNLYQYHTRTMTGKVQGINRITGVSYVEIHPNTAEKYGILDGTMVEVTSPRGSICVEAVVTDKIQENLVFIPFHYEEGKANMLTNSLIDEISNTPELKVAKVFVHTSSKSKK